MRGLDPRIHLKKIALKAGTGTTPSGSQYATLLHIQLSNSREGATLHSRGAEASGCCQNCVLEQERAQERPDAGRTREPCVQKKCTLRTQATTGSAKNNRPSLRNGSNGCFVLSLVYRAF
jgi:hypothetical protein